MWDEEIAENWEKFCVINCQHLIENLNVISDCVLNVAIVCKTSSFLKERGFN